MGKPISYRSIDASCVEKLIDFFSLISLTKGDQYFHPHPFNESNARLIANYQGRDLYFIQTKETCISGYGMLRGWDEDYEIPSLGIIIHPDFRGKGLGENFMYFLHEQAAKRGAKKIMLKVYPGNQKGITLYKKLGYEFKGKQGDQFVGFLSL